MKKALLAVPAAVALLATGVVVGHELAGAAKPALELPAVEPEVVYRNAMGEARTVGLAEAADRLERMDAALAKRREREAEATDASAPPPPAGDPPSGFLALRPDGKPFTADDYRDMARNATDPGQRVLAIRELRRDDTDASRAVLRDLLADKSGDARVREEAAKALASPPNRDRIPEELVTALSAESDPAVRRALAQGVARMRDRAAWMGEIVALVHAEKDPDTRKALFDAVVADARDPAARAELLSVGTDATASLEERRAALAALPRGRADEADIAKFAALLTNEDAKIRANAVALAASANAITPGALSAALTDADPGVRRAALDQGASRIAAFGKDKTVLASDVERLVEQTTALAEHDADAAVRRSAVQQVGALPKPVRDQVLAAARQDPDLFVKMTAYARSPEDVARGGAAVFVSGLSSDDAGARDFAYRQLQRHAGVTEPFDARWNAKARASAIERIRQSVAASGW